MSEATDYYDQYGYNPAPKPKKAPIQAPPYSPGPQKTKPKPKPRPVPQPSRVNPWIGRRPSPIPVPQPMPNPGIRPLPNLPPYSTYSTGNPNIPPTYNLLPSGPGDNLESWLQDYPINPYGVQGPSTLPNQQITPPYRPIPNQGITPKMGGPKPPVQNPYNPYR